MTVFVPKYRQQPLAEPPRASETKSLSANLKAEAERKDVYADAALRRKYVAETIEAREKSQIMTNHDK